MTQDFRQTKRYNDYQRHRMRMRRLAVIRTLVVTGFVLLWAVFWYLQIVRGPEYRQLAEDNRLHHRVERALRGPLIDDTGEVMVTNRPTFAVYLAPERAKPADQERDVRALARVLGEKPEPLIEQLARARRIQRKFDPVLLLADVDLETASRIEAHRVELPSIDVEMTAKRSYVLGKGAAHVLGYVSQAGENDLKNNRDLSLGDRVGKAGAEKAYDGELRGVAGISLEEVNASGRPLGVVGQLRPPKNGRAMRLTMDAQLQRDLVEAFGDNIGAAVFLDPFTGGVKALYSAPAFDPNDFGGRLSPDIWKALVTDKDRPMHNRVIASAYNPGSTFKVVMATAALEEGATTTLDRVFCGGSANFYGRTFMCWRKGGHGTIGVQDAITRSCNVFFYTMGKRLGAEKIHKWAHAFGLGEPLGDAFGNVLVGSVPNDAESRKTRKQQIYPGEVISMAIGQGLTQISPMQNAMVAAAIANGGYRVFPHLVDRPGDAQEAVPIGISPETLRTVTAGMINVVESDAGTARRARVPGGKIQVAGKTGTAQTIGRDAVTKQKDNAWFMGFAPVDHPQLAWAIIVERGGHGGDAAAPIAGAVLKRWFERQAAKGHALPDSWASDNGETDPEEPMEPGLPTQEAPTGAELAPPDLADQATATPAADDADDATADATTAPAPPPAPTGARPTPARPVPGTDR